jgi:hypothetical protein
VEALDVTAVILGGWLLVRTVELLVLPPPPQPDRKTKKAHERMSPSFPKVALIGAPSVRTTYLSRRNEKNL